jgi:hypothetical protein
MFQPMFDDGHISVVCNVILVSPARMVGMTVGNDGIFYRPPRIKIHVGLLAINALIIENEKRLVH